MQTYKRVMKGINHVNFPTKCQGDVADLIRSLLQKEASDRLPMRPGGIENVMTHPWYKKFDWESYRERKMVAPYIPIDETDMTAESFNTFTEAKTAPEPPPYQDDGSGWD